MTCTPGALFPVLDKTQTLGRTAQSSLFVVTGSNEAYLAMGTDNGKHVIVARVTDKSGPSRVADYTYVDIPGSMHVTGAALAKGALHVTGFGDYNQTGTWGKTDLAFPLQGSVIGSTPNPVDQVDAPAICNGIHRAFYRFDSNGNRYSAMSCVEKSEGGQGAMDLYIDGHLVGSNPTPDGSYDITNFAIAQDHYVVLTGEAPGEGVVFSGQLGSTTYVSSGKIKFQQSSPNVTWPMAAWQSTGGTSFFIMDVDFDHEAGSFNPPATLYEGTLSSLDGLTTVPPPSMTPVGTINDQTLVMLYGRPEPVPIGTALAEGNFAGDRVHFSLFSKAGALLVLDQPVVQSTNVAVTYPDTAVGAIGANVFVVWNQYDAGPGESTVEGQLFDCH